MDGGLDTIEHLYYKCYMSPERVVTFRPDEDILAAMEAIKERDGIPYSEQIRRALREWLQQKQVLFPKHSARAEARALRKRYVKATDISVQQMNPRKGCISERAERLYQPSRGPKPST